jgi:hypothetical protein
MISLELFLAIFFGWLIFITWLLFNIRSHYFRLTETSGKVKIDEILNSLLAFQKQQKEEIEIIKKKLEQQIEKSKYHLQTINIVRFLPFEKAGDPSFVIALLDEKRNGVVINFLYTREGLRVYAKDIKEGKGESYPLTEEEEKAIELVKTTQN